MGIPWLPPRVRGGEATLGERANHLHRVGFRYPDESEYHLPMIRAELCSLASLLDEIMTFTKPYQGLEEQVVLKREAEGGYSDVSEVPLSDAMTSY